MFSFGEHSGKKIDIALAGVCSLRLPF